MAGMRHRSGTHGSPLRRKSSTDDRAMRLFILVIAIYLVIALAFPLYVMFSKSLENSQGAFVGFQNYLEYFNTPALVYSIQNSLFIGVVTTTITVTIAFILAYALTRSRMPGKPVFKTIAMIPILVPSLLPGIALIYLFGRQGLINELLFGYEIYGPIGIVIAEVFFTLPHARSPLSSPMH